jgi:hypothetical protein
MPLDPAKYENLSDKEIIDFSRLAAAPLEDRIKKFLMFTTEEDCDRSWNHDASFICVALMVLRQAANRLEARETVTHPNSVKAEFSDSEWSGS